MRNRETPTSLVEALHLIKANRWATVAELAEWAGVDDATVYAWMAPNGPEPKWNAIRLICKHSRDERIQLALAHAFIAGTPLQVTSENADKVPATAAAIDAGLVDVFTEVSDFATKTKKAISDGNVSFADAASTGHEWDEAKAAGDKIVRAMQEAAELESKKKITTGPRLSTG